MNLGGLSLEWASKRSGTTDNRLLNCAIAEIKEACLIIEQNALPSFITGLDSARKKHSISFVFIHLQVGHGDLAVEANDADAEARIIERS